MVSGALIIASVGPEQGLVIFLLVIVLVVPGAPVDGLGHEILVVLGARVLSHELHNVVVNPVIFRDVHGAHEIAINDRLEVVVDLAANLGEAPKKADGRENDRGVDAKLSAEKAIEEKEELHERRDGAGRGQK